MESAGILLCSKPLHVRICINQGSQSAVHKVESAFFIIIIIICKYKFHGNQIINLHPPYLNLLR